MTHDERAPGVRTFVLVHGAWHGGWCWRRVSRLLRSHGHEVFTPTLTGLGERSHLLGPGIDLDTHVTDVVNVIAWEDLENVVLVGHSYAGWVISGAVEKMPERIASIVYLDAFMPQDGERGLDLQTPESRAATLATLKRGDIARPVPPPEAFNVNPRDRDWVAAKLTPQPIGVALQPIRQTGARERIAKKTYIRATGSVRPHYDRCCERLKADPSWRVYTLPCGHDVMIDMPERLADILLEVA